MRMRFVDASVFLYAYLKPKKAIPPSLAETKRNAKGIIARINAGEMVATSLTQISEVANILEAVMPLDGSRKVTRDLISANAIEVLEPRKENFLDAIEVAEDFSVGLNDAVAYILMRTNEIEEIYSFDSHFDQLPDIKRITR